MQKVCLRCEKSVNLWYNRFNGNPGDRLNLTNDTPYTDSADHAVAKRPGMLAAINPELMSNHQDRSSLKIYLLGTPEIYLNAKPLIGLAAKTQALLFYLAMTRQAHPRTPLATLLWGDSPEKNARASLRKVLRQLHQTLPDQLITVDQSVALATDERVWVDAVFFADQLAQAEAHNDIALLEAALQHYRGDFLSGFFVRKASDFEAWQATQQVRLREQLLGALQTLSRHWIAQNNLANAIAITRRIIGLEPWREEAHRQLMELLAHNGERGQRWLILNYAGSSCGANWMSSLVQLRWGLLPKFGRGWFHTPMVHNQPYCYPNVQTAQTNLTP